jgi:membrane-bound lytic murein transglycosylase D
MNVMILLCCLLVSTVATHASANYRVPNTIKFVDLTLHLDKDVQLLVQKKVNELTRSKLHLTVLAEKASLFFPLIEKILKEEGVHQDFRYLIIQESGFVGDCINSEAVGYWQFKKATALDMGLLVNEEIDERMHLIHATRGAAKYLVYNNQKFFNNWLYSLLAYNQGPGGALKLVDKKYFGKKNIKLDSNTHWYIIHFLAHKIVFEKLKYNKHSSLSKLHIYDGVGGMKSHDIANKFDVHHSLLKAYNPWIKNDTLPLSKKHPVIIPIGLNKKIKQEQALFIHLKNDLDISFYKAKENPDLFPVIAELAYAKHPRLLLINGLIGIVANKEDTITTLSSIGGISVNEFLNFNNIDQGHVIIPGQVYYFEKKNRRANVHYHTLLYDESLWSVSQKYGIKLSSLLTKNRLKNVGQAEVRDGMVLWLRFIRPKNVPICYIN